MTNEWATSVEVGEGARMLVPKDLEWQLRYGNAEKVRYVAASVIECYDYLIRHCTQKEAMRRLRLLRKAIR